METIQIYHTNDLHSHLENWPRIQQFLKNELEKSKEMGDDVFLFDIGDFIDRWHPLTEATKGLGNIDLLNESHYTAVTIGNNEGINLPHQDLNHLYDDADFDVILANLYNSNGSYPEWVKPYKIYFTKKGTRVAVIGLTANFSRLYELLGWKLTDPLVELQKVMELVRQEADVIILLSHLGIRDDEQIAAQFPDIDVILGAHTHHFLERGKLVNHTLLGAAGKYGYYVGQMTLHLEGKKVIRKEAVLYDTKEIYSPTNELEQVNHYITEGKKLLSQHVTTLSEPLVHSAFRETNFSLLLCRSLRQWCQADCAMINAGLLLGTLSGKVTEYDVLSVCPHPINPCLVELTGRELQSIIEQSTDEALHNREIKGLGFRGTVLGIFVYDGICFEENRILINDHEVEDDRNYTLALPDMFTFGHFFQDVLPLKEKNYFLPEFLRDLLKWKLKSTN